ncbi:MAG TPA: hypothetical protein DCY27_08800 [Desulfobacterales bacterium]|nr:hypothetical protein [Desulfobacterales bacterium]
MEQAVILESAGHSLDEVLRALSEIRVEVTMEEFDLQAVVAERLTSAGICYQKEHYLGPRNRIDFLVAGGVGIEVKKGKPARAKVMQQLQRYTSSREIKAVILVVERNVNISREINGKPCISFGLNKLWGVAL